MQPVAMFRLNQKACPNSFCVIALAPAFHNIMRFIILFIAPLFTFFGVPLISTQLLLIFLCVISVSDLSHGKYVNI